MITLSRTKTITVAFMGVEVEVTFNVPTAEEVETTIRGAKDLKDSDLIKAFVTSVKSAEISGWQDGISAEETLASPGTYQLVNAIAQQIVQSAFLTEKEKN